tara:strand:+ start:331 stop:1323 length:993 start_codon:yes stop_codon:yes gene_type:complete
MTNNAKPTGLQTNMQETEQSFESFLTPSEQPENEIEEQASEELVNQDEVIEDNESYEEELEADVYEDEPQEDQVEEEESEQPQLYTIKVDGEDTEVTLEELQNGYSRQRDYTRKTQELAQQRKAIEAKYHEVSQKDAIYSQLLPKMESTLRGELENEPDWNALYEADPIAYVREKDVWNEKKQKLQAVQAESQRLKQESNVVQQQKLQKFLQYGQQQLLEQIPEWQDNEKASKEKMAIRDYGVNVLGYTPQEMDSVYDYRVLLGLRNAWLQHKTQQATKVKPTEKKAAARTARPGTSNVPKTTTPVKRARQKLAKTGKVQDAAKLFEQLL